MMMWTYKAQYHVDADNTEINKNKHRGVRCLCSKRWSVRAKG